MTVNDTTKQAYLDGNYTKHLKIYRNGSSTHIPENMLIADSMELKETLVPSGDLDLSGCVATSFKVEFFGFNDFKEGDSIKAVMTIDVEGSEPVTLFNGKVYEISNNASALEHIKITAYDKMYELSQTDATNWYSNLHYPEKTDWSGYTDADLVGCLTGNQVMTSFFTTFGINISGTFDSHANYLVKKSEITQLSALDFLKSSMGCLARGAIFDRNGILRLRGDYNITPIEDTDTVELPFYRSVSVDLNELNKSKSYWFSHIPSKTVSYVFSNKTYNNIGYDEAKEIADEYGFYVFSGNKTFEDSILSLSGIIDTQNRQWESLTGVPNYTLTCNGLPFVEVGLTTITVEIPLMGKRTGQSETDYIDISFVVLDRTLKGIQNLVDTYTYNVSFDVSNVHDRNANKEITTLQSQMTKRPESAFVTQLPEEEEMVQNRIYFLRKEE